MLFSSRAPIGHVAINSVPIATNQGFKSFVPNERIDASFLYWWLDANRSHLQSMGTGATFKEVSKAAVQRIKIPLPPLEEQKRIAGILDQADALRRLRTRALDKLNTLGQAIFHEMFGDVVTNSNGFPMVTVGNVTDCVVPGRNKPKSFTGDIPWVTTAELVHLGSTSRKNSKLGLSQDEIKSAGARIIPSESVIMTCVGDLGVASIAGDEMVINQQLHSFQCGPEIFPDFLMRVLPHQKHWMLRRATQTTLPYMNKTTCNSIPIPLPPVELQRIFSNRIRKLSLPEVKSKKSEERMESLFSSLQHRAFRGGL